MDCHRVLINLKEEKEKMRISECKNCEFFKEKKYSITHYPANYHAVGFSYKYGFCEKKKNRCINVKKSECTN